MALAFRKIVWLLLVCWASVAMAVDDAADMRTWSDRSGAYKIRASLVRILNEKITLQREDGRHVTLALAQISEADQRFIASVMSGHVGDIEYNAATGDVKLRASTSDSRPPDSPEIGSSARGYIESEADISVAPQLALAPSDNWTYQPGEAPPVNDRATKQVELPFVLKAAPTRFSIVPLPKGNKVLVSFLGLEAAQSNTSTIVLCDVASGQAQWFAKANDELPLAISADGHWLLNVRLESAISNGSELRLYRCDGKSLQRFIVWRPYTDGTNPDAHPANVAWAAFVDGGRLLTLSDSGWLALWEAPDISPLWCLDLHDRSASPAISADGKYLAVIADNTLYLIELSSGKVAGAMATDLSGAKLTFRADGKRLAGVAGDRICIWNLETKQVDRDFNLVSSAGSDDSIAWIDNDHLLLGSLVIDIQRRVEIWRYMYTLDCAAQAGRLWFVGQPKAMKLTLASTRAIPQQALDAVAKLKPEELVVIAPGMDVSVELQASGDVQSARENLERKLKDNGMNVVSVGKVRLIGTVTPGETKTVRMLRFGQSSHNPNAGTEHTITEYAVNLCFKVGDQTVWRRDYPAALPPFIDMKEGETVDQALQRLSFRDASYLTRYALPKYLARLPDSATK